MWWDPNIYAKHTNNKIRVVKFYNKRIANATTLFNLACLAMPMSSQHSPLFFPSVCYVGNGLKWEICIK